MEGELSCIISFICECYYLFNIHFFIIFFDREVNSSSIKHYHNLLNLCDNSKLELMLIVQFVENLSSKTPKF